MGLMQVLVSARRSEGCADCCGMAYFQPLL